MSQRITKRIVDALKVGEKEFTVWDDALTGFGLRVRPSGAMSYVVVYRAGAGRGAPTRRFTIASIGKTTPEAARRRAQGILGAVAHGQDPASDKATERDTLTVSGLADRFLAEHVEQKRKAGTVVFYRHLLDKIIRPGLGATKADKVTKSQRGVACKSLSDQLQMTFKSEAICFSTLEKLGREELVKAIGQVLG